MPKINVYLPDDLAEAVKDAGVPVSAICQRALERAVRRVTAIREIGAGAPLDSVPDSPTVSFTRRSMTALQTALDNARAEGAAETDTGHFLRALLVHGDMAVEVLSALDITPRQVLVALGQRAPAGDPAGGAQAGGAQAGGAQAPEPALSSQVAAIIELAANESSGLGNNFIGSEHLLLGVLGEPDGVAGSVLRSLGVDLRIARRTVAAALAGYYHGVSAQERRAAQEVAATPLAGTPDQLSAAIRAELEPLIARLDQLERSAAG
jgi:ATP-dependent Clp protease ATP-binding subunit ClpC